MNILEIIPYATFILCIIPLIWAFFLYPIFLKAAKKFYKPVKKAKIRPTISIIIPAYNEETFIEEKIINTLSLEYPKDKLEILVVDDGSSDATAEIARRFKEIKVIELGRVGKNRAINEALKVSSGEIVIVTDADSFSLQKDALVRIVENFADSSVGAVSAIVSFSESESAFIRKFFSDFSERNKKIWMRESMLDSITSGLGVFLAFRKKLVPQLHVECFADDVEISVRVREKGFRIVYEPSLQIVTPAPSSFKVWYKQYVRRTLSGLVTIFNHKHLLFNPKYGWYGLVILPTRSLFLHFSPFLALGCLFSLFFINPLICYIVVALFLVMLLFSFLFRKLLLIGTVMVHAWILFILKRYGPKYWMKEPRLTRDVSKGVETKGMLL
ncbi:MAG TPA: glycosyltransferase [Candidatus Bathyarchaeota archaeon]|nr:glycosyltransferase [Candidatus Bathyarchaeota archaeon]